MKEWQRYRPDETVYSGHRKVIRKYFKNNDGKTFDFETFESLNAESVIVLALNAQNQVIITEQFRVGPEAIMQDCPGGALKKGQNPEEAAKAELLEETGYASDEWKYLGATHEHPYSNRTRHYFLATNARSVASPSIDDLEDIELKYITIEQLIDNAKSGRMTDALVVLYAYDFLETLQLGNS